MKKTILRDKLPELRDKLPEIIKKLNNTLNSVNPKAAAKILGAGIIGSMLLFGTNINAVEPSAFAGYNEQQGKVENKNKETKEYNPQMYSNDNRSAFGNGISVTNKVKEIKQKVKSPPPKKEEEKVVDNSMFEDILIINEINNQIDELFEKVKTNNFTLEEIKEVKRLVKDTEKINKKTLIKENQKLKIIENVLFDKDFLKDYVGKNNTLYSVSKNNYKNYRGTLEGKISSEKINNYLDILIKQNQLKKSNNGKIIYGEKQEIIIPIKEIKEVQKKTETMVEERIEKGTTVYQLMLKGWGKLGQAEKNIIQTKQRFLEYIIDSNNIKDPTKLKIGTQIIIKTDINNLKGYFYSNIDSVEENEEGELEYKKTKIAEFKPIIKTNLKDLAKQKLQTAKTIKDLFKNINVSLDISDSIKKLERKIKEMELEKKEEENKKQENQISNEEWIKKLKKEKKKLNYKKTYQKIKKKQEKKKRTTYKTDKKINNKLIQTKKEYIERLNKRGLNVEELISNVEIAIEAVYGIDLDEDIKNIYINGRLQVIDLESNFNLDASNDKTKVEKSYGLGQINIQAEGNRTELLNNLRYAIQRTTDNTSKQYIKKVYETFESLINNVEYAKKKYGSKSSQYKNHMNELKEELKDKDNNGFNNTLLQEVITKAKSYYKKPKRLNRKPNKIKKVFKRMVRSHKLYSLDKYYEGLEGGEQKAFLIMLNNQIAYNGFDIVRNNTHYLEFLMKRHNKNIMNSKNFIATNDYMIQSDKRTKKPEKIIIT
jgi:hypothetical protein